MSKKTRICLLLTAAFSIAGLFTSIHLAEIHYKKPRHVITLLNRIPLLEKRIDRKKYEDQIKKEQLAKLKDPFEDKEFDPYAQAQNAFDNVATEEDAKKETPSAGGEACDYNEILSCSRVDESPYSELGGVAVSLYGVFGYIALILLSLLRLAGGKAGGGRDIPAFLLLASCAGGVAFSIWLTYLEAFVIKAYCPYCLASAAFILLCLISVLAGFGLAPVKNIFSKKQ